MFIMNGFRIFTVVAGLILVGLSLAGCGAATPATTTVTATEAITEPTATQPVVGTVTSAPATISASTNVPATEVGSPKPSTGPAPASAYPYDRAEDYSWVAGQLKQEGSCWIIAYISPLSKSKPDQYNNHFALLPSNGWDAAKVKDGEWAIVQGQPEPGIEVAPGCSAHGYKASGLWPNPNAPGGSGLSTPTTPMSVPAPTSANVPTTEAGSPKPSTGPATAKPYDHAADYSWVAGQLRQEGSCWIVTYISPLVDMAPDQYNNQFALLPGDGWDVAKVKNSEWVIVQGQPESGTAPASGCTAHGYIVTGLRPNPNAPVDIPAPSGSSVNVRGGMWGGEHTAMSVRDASTILDFDCAHANISQTLNLDATGHFDVAGTYVPEHGGPVGVDETGDSHPARFKGVTDGRTMTLTVMLTDTNQQVGTFTLTFGAPAGVFKCL